MRITEDCMIVLTADWHAKRATVAKNDSSSKENENRNRLSTDITFYITITMSCTMSLNNVCTICSKCEERSYQIILNLYNSLITCGDWGFMARRLLWSFCSHIDDNLDSLWSSTHQNVNDGVSTLTNSVRCV